MKKSVTIGIVGDYEVSRISQVKTDEALAEAGDFLGIRVLGKWLPTKSLQQGALTSILKDFDGIWCGPGDYVNPRGAHEAIRFCRESNRPFLGT